ncbi:MAG: hypothetical protein V1761_00315, partial [bacterium]
MLAIICLLLLGLTSAGLPIAAANPDAIAGRIIWNGNLYTYGRESQADRPADGDGWLQITDTATGSMIAETLYDDGLDEAFVYFAVLASDRFALVSETRGIADEGLTVEIERTDIVLFDDAGTILDVLILDGRMAAYNNHGYCLILSATAAANPDFVLDANLEYRPPPPGTITVTGTFDYQFRGSASIDGVAVNEIVLCLPGSYVIHIESGVYEYAFTLFIDPGLAGIENEGEYDGPVTITAAGVLTIDGMAFETGTTVAEPGFHELVIAGANEYCERIAFVIHPLIANVSAGLETAAAVRIFSNAGSLTLDGQPYVAGDLIATPGHHVLIAYGANGYVKTIPFVILPSVTGIEDGETYVEKAAFSINGTAVLDGVTVTGNVVVDTVGEHELVLILSGEAYATLSFFVTAKPLIDPWWRTAPVAEIGLGILALVGL